MPLTSAEAITISGIQCWDEDASEEFRVGGGSRAPRTIVCAWDNRIALALALAGGTTRVGIIETNTPAASYPDATWMQVQNIRTEGVGKRKVGVNGMVGYDYARLFITYGDTERDLGQTQDLGALSLDISSEIISPPRDEATFKWVSDDEDVTPEATPGLPISTTRFERVRRNVGGINVPLILSLVDHVNDATFEGAAPGTIVFNGARPFRKITNLGAQNWDIAYQFTHRRIPWNYFLRPSTGQWEEIVYKNSGDPFFPDGNLSALYL